MRALVISDQIKAKIRAQVEWAERPENWYWPMKDAKPPGDDLDFVTLLDHGFRVVYSHTVMPDSKHFRHLSVSVEGSKYPHQMAVFTLATMFGFSGGRIVEDVTIEPGPWIIEVKKHDRCIVLAELFK